MWGVSINSGYDGKNIKKELFEAFLLQTGYCLSNLNEE